MRANALFYGGVIKPRRAVNTIAIEHRHRAHPALSASFDHFLGDRSPLEKTERRPRMKLDIHFSLRKTWLARRLIVKSPHKPTLPRQIVKNPIHAMPRPRTRLRNLRSPVHVHIHRDQPDALQLLLARFSFLPKINRQVPLIVIPAIFLPPLTRTPPRPRRRNHISAHTAKTHARWPTTAFAIHFHIRNKRWTQHAKSRRRKFRDAFSKRVRILGTNTRSSLFLPASLSSPPVRCPRNRPASPPRHPKILRAMRVDQFRHADIRLPNQLPQPRHRQFQLFRIGPARHKQSALRRARRRRFRRHPYFLYRRFRRIRLQRQSQKLQQHFCVAHCHRQRQHLRKLARRRFLPRFVVQRLHIFLKRWLQLKQHANRLHRQRPRLQPRANLIEQPPQQKRERLQFLDRLIQLHFFFKRKTRLRQHQRPHTRPARQFMQQNSALSHPFRKLQHRQFRQPAQRLNPPSIQRLQNFRIARKRAHRQHAQPHRFFSRQQNRNPRKSARRQNRRLNVRRDRNIGRNANTHHALHQNPRNLLIASKQ